MEIDTIILERYVVKEELGKGSFGKVYRIQHLYKNKSFALKVDITQKGNVLLEAKVLKELQGGLGIPKLYKCGSNNESSYMIMELLQSNLNTLMKKSNGNFTLPTVVSVILQILSRLEYVHMKGFLHRDIKPHQMLIGQNPRMIYLTDFGLAKRFQMNTHHISFQQNCPRTGNATFSSINNHTGIRQSRRDDLESVAYMAIYLLKGQLPWQLGRRMSSISKWQNVFIIKNSIAIDVLCSGCPKEFGVFLRYCRNLRFEDKPDYVYIKNLFGNLRNQENLPDLYFDWIPSNSNNLDGELYDSIDNPNLRRNTLIARELEFTGENTNKKDSALKKSITNIHEKNIKTPEIRKGKKGRSKTLIVTKKIENLEKNVLSNEIFRPVNISEKEYDYNSLESTPRNILPEMKNRKLILSLTHQKKFSEYCNIN
jgi:serine/threonine protein kinase